MATKASVSEASQATSVETFKEPLFISRVIMTSLGVTAIPDLRECLSNVDHDRTWLRPWPYSYTMPLIAR